MNFEITDFQIFLEQIYFSKNHNLSSLVQFYYDVGALRQSKAALIGGQLSVDLKFLFLSSRKWTKCTSSNTPDRFIPAKRKMGVSKEMERTNSSLEIRFVKDFKTKVLFMTVFLRCLPDTGADRIICRSRIFTVIFIK